MCRTLSGGGVTFTFRGWLSTSSHVDRTFRRNARAIAMSEAAHTHSLIRWQNGYLERRARERAVHGVGTA